MDVSDFAKKELKMYGATAPFLGYGATQMLFAFRLTTKLYMAFQTDVRLKMVMLLALTLVLNLKRMITDSAFTKIVGKSTKVKNVF